MTTQEIADLVSGELIGDGTLEIDRIAALGDAGPRELAFAESANGPIKTNAACILVPLDAILDGTQPVIRVKNPKLAFTIAAKTLIPDTEHRAFVHTSASVDPTAIVDGVSIAAHSSVGAGTRIGSGSRIHEGVRIGKNVKIGVRTEIFPNCVVYDNVTIGEGCVIHGGVILGARGFGFVKDESGEYLQFPQIGTVVLEDRVEIGANTCIDRGALGETRIGEGTKIDNLVQIGHNVKIGRRVVIAAQTGISGSTVVEDDCVIGGQVGMGDHARVLSGAVIGSQAGVLPGKIVRAGVWWGTPVQPLETYKRQNALVKGLSRMKEDLRDAKDRLSRIEDQQE